MSSPPTVIITGCGIAGPVLSILLKNKGYRPVVYEKVRMLGEAGGSLMMNPNGLKVLNLVNSIDNLFKDTVKQPITHYWHGKSSGETLALNDLPSQFESRYGQPTLGIKRSRLNLSLKEMLLDGDIELHEGYELVDIEESESSITAHFRNGESATGSFLIGCDGIKAASRRILLEKSGSKEGAPAFTGLTQTGGLSKTPDALLEKPGTALNWYGQGVHVIAYPVSTTHISWAVSLPQEHEEPETWKLASDGELEARQNILLERVEGFEPVVFDLIRGAERIICYGLFDRMELDLHKWHSKRCVLVGDAAHPTSPHLGQGANQALEDCYHLRRLLPKLDGHGDSEKLADLTNIFEEYARIRQPRTSALVKGARKMGEERVVVGDAELCRQRDVRLVAQMGDTDALLKGFDGLFREPF